MTDDTIVADAPPPAPPARPARMSTGDTVRFVLRGIGQTLITAGLVVLLFVVYEVWITNVFSQRENNKIFAKNEQAWQNGDDPLLPLPGIKDPTIPLGTGIANMYMPRLGRDYREAVVEGTDQDNLAKGPGHYTGTALPGAIGNFSVAGHRVGKGEPFLNIDKLRAGDAVIVETKSFWYVYRVKGKDHGLTKNDDVDGIPGREIVNPSEGRVLLPVPNHPDTKPTERLLTMTTCHPKFTAAKRMIIHAVLEGKPIPVQLVGGNRAKTMPPSVAALYAEVKA